MSQAALSNENTGFYFEMGKLQKQHTQFLSDYFDNIPTNPYKDGESRLIRFSHFSFIDNVLVRLSGKSFLQSSKFNSFQGDIERRYEEIEDDVVESAAFLEMFQQFKDKANVPDDADIDVHQFRVIAPPNGRSSLAPEGVHQDGFEHIAMCVIQRKNIKVGGEICVHSSKDSSPLIKYPFDNGEIIVLNDQCFWHSATDFVAESDDHGMIDLFVLTA